MIRGFTMALLPCLALLAIAPASGEEPDVDTTELARVLKTCLMGKEFAIAEKRDVFDEGKLESISTQTRSFRDMAVYRDGLTFDVLVRFKQTTWKLDPNGKRVGAGVKRDRVNISRYSITRSKATGEYTGLLFDPTSPGGGRWVRIKVIGDNGLQFRSGTVLYEDFYSGEGGKEYRPGASEDTTIVRKNDAGRFVLDIVDIGYGIDPETLKRTEQDTIKETLTEVTDAEVASTSGKP